LAKNTALTTSHLDRLDAEEIHIMREAVAEARAPVILFSGGKDSPVIAHLAVKVFYPSRPPLPLLHIDSTWKFQDLLAFRDTLQARMDLL